MAQFFINRPIFAWVLAIVIIGKSLAAYAILKLFKRSDTTAITVAASLAQIGEFSFILAGLGVDLEILPREGRDLILAGAIISIMLNPLIVAVALRAPKTAPVEPAAPTPAAPEPEPANDLAPYGPEFTAAVTAVRDFLAGRRTHLNDEIVGPYLAR